MATSSDTAENEPGLPRALDVYIGFVAMVAAIALTALVVTIETGLGHGRIEWGLFAAISVLLLITETRPGAGLKFGTEGIVTPSWAFAFALVLLGSPSLAITTMAATTLVADISMGRDTRKIVFNVSQVSISLALGGLTFNVFGIHTALFETLTIPPLHGVAMIASGVVVFTSNGVITGLLLTILEGKRFVAIMRQGLVLSMSADAAMLAIAPILVVSLQVSLLMLPLIGATSFLIFQTARQAMQRAHEANHDPLTTLFNRRAFLIELEAFVLDTDTMTGAVFVLDLDRFKEVNDRLGHRTGDHVLQRFAERLIRNLPGNAVVARLGGDEFAVFLPGSSSEHASGTAQMLHDTFQTPLSVDGFPISAGGSIGIALFPQHGSTSSELLHAADIAMYRAKRYRTGVEMYEVFGTTRERGRVGLLGDIAQAIDHNEYQLDYQPQINMATGRIEVVEALLRWHHPTLGLIAPGDFIGLAEQTDLIGPLTRMVVNKALTDFKSLPNDCRLALNISARNLQDRHFASETLAALELAGFDPTRLELEITESAIANDPELSLVAIGEFRSLGATVAIDDFGTGYVSFAMLRDLSVDRLKIDRSFVAIVASQSRESEIVRSIIELAHRLDLRVVAEGVETREAWDELFDLGCDLAQGYFCSRPMPVDHVRTLLQNNWVMQPPTNSATGTA